jgi:hypothetical protein
MNVHSLSNLFHQTHLLLPRAKKCNRALFERIQACRQHAGQNEQHARAPHRNSRMHAAIKCVGPGSAGLPPAHAGMLPACLGNAQDLFGKSKSLP